MLEADRGSRVSDTEAHLEYLKLCALAVTGELSAEQTLALNHHLAGCSPCSQAMLQYRAILDQALPAIGASAISRAIDQQDSPLRSVNMDRAESALFAAINDDRRRQAGDRQDVSPDSGVAPQLGFSSASAWRRVWALYAVAALLFVGVGACAYWWGLRQDGRSATTATSIHADPASEEGNKLVALQAQLSDASHDRNVAMARIEQREMEIADLRRQLQRQSLDLHRMSEVQQRLQLELSGRSSEKIDLAKQLDDATQRLEAAQADEHATQVSMQALLRQSTGDAARLRHLEAKIGSLTEQLQARENTIEQQQLLLSHDRDIRELMGARELYIAEVYDVGRSGETQKPYGRVFYTKGKSLIFYAYDLDQQAGAKAVSTFQAWGRRGPDRARALNLGVFYVDNAAKKRWVLKLSDPKQLDQIDAVFVTLEPRGGSQKPTGSPLLFAYLRVEPNHP